MAKWVPVEKQGVFVALSKVRLMTNSMAILAFLLSTVLLVFLTDLKGGIFIGTALWILLASLMAFSIPFNGWVDFIL